MSVHALKEELATRGIEIHGVLEKEELSGRLMDAKIAEKGFWVVEGHTGPSGYSKTDEFKTEEKWVSNSVDQDEGPDGYERTDVRAYQFE